MVIFVGLNCEILFNLPRASSARVTRVGHMFIIGQRYTKGRVSELLCEASRLVPSSSTTASNPAVNASRSAAIPQATINETLRRAEEMLQESTFAGLCRRLN